MPGFAPGLIFELDFDELLSVAWDGEPDKARPVVVISPQSLNHRLETVIVAPTTASQVDERSEMATNVLLVPGKTADGINERCVVQLHLLYAVSHRRLGSPIGFVTDPDTRDDIQLSATYAVGDLWMAG